MKYTFLIVKTAVTCALIYWLISQIDSEIIRNIFARANVYVVLLSLGIMLVVSVIGCLRWWMLIGHFGVPLSFYQVLPSYFLGLFFNNFLPTGFGGDLARTVHLSLKGHSTRVLISSALADRMIGLVAMVLMATASLLLSPDIRISANSKSSLVLAVLSVVVAGLIALKVVRRISLEHLRNRYKHTRVRRILLDIILALLTYRTAGRTVIGAALLSVCMQSLVILIYLLLGTSIGIELSVSSYFAFVLVVQLVTTLPISIGGLGIREGTLVALLTSTGIDTQLSVALSLLFLLTMWLSSLPGAVIFLFNKHHRTEILRP